MGLKQFLKRKMRKEQTMTSALEVNKLYRHLPILQSTCTPMGNLLVNVNHTA